MFRPRITILICLISIFIRQSQAQVPISAASNALVITKMAANLHIDPRPVDDSLSVFVYTHLLNELDDAKVLFTRNEINAFEQFKFSIDDEIRSRKTGFLSAVTASFSRQVKMLDTMITSLTAKPFNFNTTDKFTVAEQQNYPSDAGEQRRKLYKLMKLSVLNALLDEDELYTMTDKQQAEFITKNEIVARKKVELRFRASLKLMSQQSGEIPQYVADTYCKAIANYYDPHTEYFPKTEKENFESELGQDKLIFGFGIKEGENGGIKITSIAAGSPAYKSGQINKGDEVISFQWGNLVPVDVTVGGVEQFNSLLRMNNHEKATIKVKKLDGSERTVVLYKEKVENDIEQNRVKSFILKGKKVIGFISLPGFYQDWDEDNEGAKGCANDVAKEILKLKKENIQGLILDMRYNGGGSMQEAIDLSGIFIDAGPVGQEKSKDPKVFTLKDGSRGTIYDGPLMIMVNGYSASAAEMVAGTLQDYHRAVIVGSPTYGKATAQVLFPLDSTVSLDRDFSRINADNFLKITIGELYRITGATAQASGVVPDLVIPDAAELQPQQERFNDHVIQLPQIEANKFYRPYPAIANLEAIKSAGKAAIAESSFFEDLTAYNKMIVNERKASDQNLMLRVALAEKQREIGAEQQEAISDSSVAPFSVEINNFTREQEQLSSGLKEFNEQWLRFLEKDPYLRVTFSAMLAMIP